MNVNTKKSEITVNVTQTKKSYKKPLIKKPEKKTSYKNEDAFLSLKKEMFGVQKDLLTGEEFIPLRRGQKFANTQNRIRYYNFKASEEYHKNITEVKAQIILKNQHECWVEVIDYVLGSRQSYQEKITYLSKNFSIKKIK